MAPVYGLKLFFYKALNGLIHIDRDNNNNLYFPQD